MLVKIRKNNKGYHEFSVGLSKYVNIGLLKEGTYQVRIEFLEFFGEGK